MHIQALELARFYRSDSCTRAGHGAVSGGWSSSITRSVNKNDPPASPTTRRVFHPYPPHPSPAGGAGDPPPTNYYGL